jgi:phage RecT family recombinase
MERLTCTPMRYLPPSLPAKLHSEQKDLLMSETKARPKLSDPRPATELKPIDVLRKQLERMSLELEVALPAHIPVERFRRVAITAINQNPELMAADRKSLFASCMRAAQDGLYPDGREGALVVYNTKVKGDDGKESWIKQVQFMPMIFGILKKIRQSGAVAKVTAHEVYQKDRFEYRLGDDEHIEHVPYMGAEEPGEVIAAYAIATFKDGTIQREVLPRWMINQFRAASKSPSSPAWTKWFGEMARKCAVRRLNKYLPNSTEIEHVLNRADAAAALADTLPSAPEGVTIDGESEDTVYDAAAPADDAGQTDQADQGQAAIAHDQTPKVTVPEAEAREMEMIDRGEPVPQQEQVQVQQTAEVKPPKKSQGKFF